jgi:predicted SnoaL-like aldol condensation-catalyzing enzyme
LLPCQRHSHDFRSCNDAPFRNGGCPPRARDLCAGRKLGADRGNKQAVLGFYQAALNDKDFDAAQKFLAPHYKQHNPTLPDGAEGIRKLTEILRARAPKMHVDIKHIFAVDDFVIIHSHSVSDPAKPGRAIADFYRMKDGLIAEHWDVIQDIPEHSANDNGMF